MLQEHFPGSVIIGAGPSGLMAAEILSRAGHPVRIYESMPTAGRKFLMAGRGGLNITHSEDVATFMTRYADAATRLTPLIHHFGPADIVKWMSSLQQSSFVGSSGRVFPNSMKAAPLLRAWLARLHQQGVELQTRHRWIGWQDNHLHLESPSGQSLISADQVIFATGGGSWKKLGSDAAWVNFLQQSGIQIQPLMASNAGFTCDWSEYLIQHHAGTPLKGILLKTAQKTQKGDLILTKYGLEGGLIYAFSAELRQALLRHSFCEIRLDLMPDLSVEQLTRRLQKPKGRNSLSNHLRKAGIAAVKSALLRESTDFDSNDPGAFAKALKNCPIRLTGMRPIDEAISTAGGIPWDELNNDFSLKKLPDHYCAGEMIDWDAPTGGYLLTACLSIAVHIAEHILRTKPLR